MPLRRLRCAAAAVVVAAVGGCADREGARPPGFVLRTGGPRPDELPTMLNAEPPFRYPADLYAQKVQGNITLETALQFSGDPNELLRMCGQPVPGA